ncbi:MAG TPA: Rpn family recombination-promoting nuclease/putative transposase [Coleofasciculaceae cyanobacterium]|jgi:predicted transposase/invertase (TIGR01784 family)
MKTDTLFHRLFQRSPSLFFELIGQPESEAGNYEFRSVENKQTSFRIDGVLLPTGDSADRPVYFSEVQFQKDQQLYHRFFAELFLYLAQNPKTYDWQGSLIYPDRTLEPEQTRLHQLLLDSPKVRRVYLNELGEMNSLPLGMGIVKLIIEPEQTAIAQARQLIQRARQEEVRDLSRQAIVELVETIIVYKFNVLSREEIEAMIGLSDLKRSKVYQEALQEGRQEGRQEGQREVIESVLRARFGELDEALAAIVEPLLILTPAESTPLLLNRSREELIAQFAP